MVRVAVEADVPRIIDMSMALRASVGSPVEHDAAWLRRSFLTMIASPMACVFVSDGGFIFGSLSPTIVSGEMIAHEHGWYATDGSGIALFNAFEGWAKEHGARVRMSTAAAPSSAMERFLTRRGYRPAELAWVNA